MRVCRMRQNTKTTTCVITYIYIYIYIYTPLYNSVSVDGLHLPWGDPCCYQWEQRTMRVVEMRGASVPDLGQTLRYNQRTSRTSCPLVVSQCLTQVCAREYRSEPLMTWQQRYIGYHQPGIIMSPPCANWGEWLCVVNLSIKLLLISYFVVM